MTSEMVLSETSLVSMYHMHCMIWLYIQHLDIFPKNSCITFSVLQNNVPTLRILLAPIHSDGQKAPIVTQTLESVGKNGGIRFFRKNIDIS